MYGVKRVVPLLGRDEVLVDFWVPDRHEITGLFTLASTGDYRVDDRRLAAW